MLHDAAEKQVCKKSTTVNDGLVIRYFRKIDVIKRIKTKFIAEASTDEMFLPYEAFNEPAASNARRWYMTNSTRYVVKDELFEE